MASVDKVRDAVAPLADERGLDLYDVEPHQGGVRVLVDRPGGIDIDTLAELTRAVNRRLEEVDPHAGTYLLEVSSPGLERPLRRPDHFAGAVGAAVTIKTVPGTEGDRRVSGTLATSDDDGVTVRTDEGDERRLGYDEIDSARTTFDWGPKPKPGARKTTTKTTTRKATR